MSKKKFQVGDRVVWQIKNTRPAIHAVVKDCNPDSVFDYIVRDNFDVYAVYEHELMMDHNTYLYASPENNQEWNMNIRHYHEGNDPHGHMRKHNGRTKKFATWVTMTSKRTHHAVIGRSFCSWKDQPNKKVGVQIAKERAHKMIDQLV